MDPNVTHTRGHSFRIIKQQCRVNARLNSFVNAWNKSSAAFKKFIDKIELLVSFCLDELAWGSVGVIYNLHLSLISLYYSFCFILFYLCCFYLLLDINKFDLL